MLLLLHRCVVQAVLGGAFVLAQHVGDDGRSQVIAQVHVIPLVALVMLLLMMALSRRLSVEREVVDLDAEFDLVSRTGHETASMQPDPCLKYQKRSGFCLVDTETEWLFVC